ncbi:MAG TPA: hypothetical protein VM734_17335 [Kofleriaceae bacterium]|jgi:hypothetical protein|nr:hypothetical protein [Kofleriaceae bacterium]
MGSTRILVTLCAAALALGAMSEVADARPRPKRGKTFTANKEFGLGLILGAPTGLSGKYFYSEDKAIDFAVGFLGRYRGRDGLHVHVDHLWHPVSLVSDSAFELPLYVGVGGRFYSFDWDDNDRYDDGQVLGVRVPVGIAFDFNNVPLDIFVELAFVLDFYVSDYDDNVDGDFNGGVGVRYWF